MSIGITPGREYRYVLRRDRALPRDQQTVFHYRVLLARERAQLEDEVTSVVDGDFRTTPNQTNLRTLEAALVGWDNYRDEDGDLIPFHLDSKPRMILGSLRCGPSQDTLDRLRFEDVAELAVAIRAGQHLTQDDAKNSSAPPESSSVPAAASGPATPAEIPS